MKKTIMTITGIVFVGALLAGCATPQPHGVIYTNTVSPITATSNVKGTKIGKATSTSILGLIATGDSSIQAAAKNGGITKISHVDYAANSILGIYGQYTTIVYGQ